MTTDGLSSNLNFSTLYNAALTLFTISTGEKYYEIMEAMGKEINPEFPCI